MNKKILPCENLEFLPQQVADSEKAKLDQTQKNVLSTLCYLYQRYHDYALKHDGWFFASADELESESKVDKSTVFRTLTKLELKNLMYRRSGTNHHCTNYKLHPAIVELMPKMPEYDANATLIESQYTETEAEKSIEETANATLVKKRLDEYSKDESSLVEEKKENGVSYAPLEEGATTHQKVTDDGKAKWYINKELDAVQDFRELSHTGTMLRDYVRNGCLIPGLEKYLDLRIKEKAVAIKELEETMTQTMAKQP